MTPEGYMSSREDLLNKERSRRRDFTYKANFSAVEKQAEAVIRRLRLEEADTIWSARHEDIPHVFPGMEFLTGKSSHPILNSIGIIGNR
jgi:adenosine deaminase CECR1